MAQGDSLTAIKPVGDAAVLVCFEGGINPDVNRRVHRLDRLVRESRLDGLVETTPAYCTLLVHYDPLILSFRRLQEWLEPLLQESQAGEEESPRLVDIPVVYGGSRGPDLEQVAAAHGLTTRQVVECHSGVEYRVYMMGFMAGFPYLGGLPASLATPRLAVPRLKVPAGSVGIGGEQTGIYPQESPGGWQIIGYTPFKLFDKARTPPSLLAPGDRVRFVPIAEEDLPGED